MSKLPSLQDLYADVPEAFKINELNRLLNVDPKPEWIREHPFAKGVKYIPIQHIERLLTTIYQKWRIEVINTQVIANAVCVQVRLHVKDPITGEWEWQDGIGAAPIQTAKGAAATDFTKVTTDAVVKAAPAAKSYALKDAAEMLGRVFGKDLNRKEWLPYTHLDGAIDLHTVDAGPERTAELWALLKEATLHPDERDELVTNIGDGVSIAGYELLKRQLNDRILNSIDKIKNGDNVGQRELTKALKDLT